MDILKDKKPTDKMNEKKEDTSIEKRN